MNNFSRALAARDTPSRDSADPSAPMASSVTNRSTAAAAEASDARAGGGEGDRDMDGFLLLIY